MIGCALKITIAVYDGCPAGLSCVRGVRGYLQGRHSLYTPCAVNNLLTAGNVDPA